MTPYFTVEEGPLTPGEKLLIIFTCILVVGFIGMVCYL